MFLFLRQAGETLGDIALTLGCTRERVRRIELKARGRMSGWRGSRGEGIGEVEETKRVERAG